MIFSSSFLFLQALTHWALWKNNALQLANQHACFIGYKKKCHILIGFLLYRSISTWKQSVVVQNPPFPIKKNTSKTRSAWSNSSDILIQHLAAVEASCCSQLKAMCCHILYNLTNTGNVWWKFDSIQVFILHVSPGWSKKKTSWNFCWMRLYM